MYIYIYVFNELVFSRGDIFGKTIVGVKVCTHPKDDMLKEEEASIYDTCKFNNGARLSRVLKDLINIPKKEKTTENNVERNIPYTLPTVCIIYITFNF